MENKSKKEEFIQGVGVSSGLVMGTAYCLDRLAPVASSRRISPDEVEHEIALLEGAMSKSSEQLRGLLELSADEATTLAFRALLQVLDEPTFQIYTEDIIRQELVCGECACARAVQHYAEMLGQVDEKYFQDRIRDIRDIGDRILRNLKGINPEANLTSFPGKCIVVVDDLTPAEVTRLDKENVLAFVMSAGSRTCHTAIIARSLGIPAVVAIKDGIESIGTGMELAIDGGKGVVIVNPEWETRNEFLLKVKASAELQDELLSMSQRPVETLDGYQACLVANVQLPEEAQSVRSRYNVGIGLFRTEFLFINGMPLQDEEAQFEAYRRTVEAVSPHSVIFRTLDIGGDKLPTQFEMPHEMNPFMGMRAIRFSLSHPEIFKVQLRAILRASAYGKVRIMFPMVSTYDELEAALKLLDEAKRELSARRIEFNDGLDVGCMIEVPSAAMLASHLIRHLTFFSLGTNDLVQYSMAVDRMNPNIGHLYQPVNPAIVKMMKQVVDVARDNGRWVSVCGEIAGDCLYTPLILGMGIHELSMSAASIPRVHRVIGSIRMHEAEHLVDYALGCDRYSDVLDACRRMVDRACPGLVDGEN